MTTTPGSAYMRSTKLSLYVAKCPHAVTLYERGVDWDRSIFATGTAAHDILHAIGEYPNEDRYDVADVVCKRLIAEGRQGHDAEGPLAPDAVYAGRDLVMDWINWGGDPHPHHVALYEHGMGFAEDWSPVSYEAGYFSIRPDVLYPCAGDEGAGRGICTRDYKTSWAHVAGHLNSMQLHLQAVAAWCSAESLFGFHPNFIRREIVNLRTRQTYQVDTWCDPEGEATLRQWLTDGAAIIDALNSEPRLPRVSRGCLTCQYQHACDPWAAVRPAAANESAMLVEEYIMSKANTKRLELMVRELTSDGVYRMGSALVGIVGKPTRVASDDAVELLWDAWLDGREVSPGLLRGMLHAAKLGATQIKAIAKVVHQKDKAKRAALVERCTQDKIKREFGIHPAGK